MATGQHCDDTPDVREYARMLGARLRAIRSQQHLSLHGVERKSGGRWKAVVVGSYERGDRAISVQRLAELAAFYEVSVSDLLPRDQAPAIGNPSPAPLTKIVLNPERVAALTDPEAALLARFATAILRQRGGHRSASLSIRNDDLRTLATIYDMSLADVTDRLVHWQVLAPDSLILDGAP